MGRKKKRKRALYPVAALLLAGVAIGGAYFFSQNRRMDMVEDEIRSLSRLITAKQTFREIIYLEKGRFLYDKRVLFSVNFTVEAGIDLSECYIGRNSKGMITLHLPSAEIFTVDCDETTITQYFNRELLGKFKYSDFSDVIEKEADDIKEEARNSELVLRAESNARSIIDNLLGAAAPRENIHIRFTEMEGNRKADRDGESLDG